MSGTCTASYVWDTDEFVKAMQRHHSLVFRNDFRIGVKVACALLMALTVFILFVAIFFPYDQPAPYGWLILIIFICSYGLIYVRVNVWWWKRIFRKRPEAGTQVEWIFAEDVLKTTTSMVEGTVKWEIFVKIVEVHDGFLFYSTEKFFHWIPFNSFDSIKCADSIREWAIEKNVPLYS